MYELKIYRGVIYHDNEERCKTWRGIDLPFQNWHKEFDEFWPEHSKVSKICTLMGSFWTKYIMIELKKFRGVTFHDSEEWCKIWRKTNLWFEKWRKEFGKFLPEHSDVSKLGFWWDPFIKIRKCMSFKFIEKLCIMTKKNDANFEEEFACRSKIDTTIWRILTWALECLENLHFARLLLTKVYNVLGKKVRKNYVWWHWWLMQKSTEELCLMALMTDAKLICTSKMTWAIWQIFSRWKIASLF